MLRLKTSSDLLLGQFLGSREVHKLQKATYQSIGSSSMENEQQARIFYRCQPMGQQDVIVQMLYLEFYRNSAYSLSLEEIMISHLFIVPTSISRYFWSPAQSQTPLKYFTNVWQYFLIRTSATSSFTLNTFFSILGSNSPISCPLINFTRSILPPKSLSSSSMSPVQRVKMDSQSQCMLVAQLRLFIMGLRLILRVCRRRETTAERTELSGPEKMGQYWLRMSYTILGVSSFFAISFMALLEMAYNSITISLTSGNSSLKWLMLFDSLMISVILCNFLRYSSSLTLTCFGSAYNASLLSSPNSRSLLSSSILTNSHSILSTFSLSFSSTSCPLNFFSSCAIISSLSFSEDSFRSMSIELPSILASLPSTALEHLYNVFSLLMNRSHSPRNLFSSWAITSSSLGGYMAGGSIFSKNSKFIANYRLINIITAPHHQPLFLPFTYYAAKSRSLEQLIISLQTCRYGNQIAGRFWILPCGLRSGYSRCGERAVSMAPIWLAALLRVSGSSMSGMRMLPIFSNQEKKAASSYFKFLISSFTFCCNTMYFSSSFSTLRFTSLLSSSSSLFLPRSTPCECQILLSNWPMYSSIFWSCFSFVTNSWAIKSKSSLPLYSFIIWNILYKFSPNRLQFSLIRSFSLFLRIQILIRSLARGTDAVMISLEWSVKRMPLVLNWSLRLSKGISLEFLNSSPRKERWFIENFFLKFSQLASDLLMLVCDLVNSTVFLKFLSLYCMISTFNPSFLSYKSMFCPFTLSFCLARVSMSPTSRAFISLYFAICRLCTLMAFLSCWMESQVDRQFLSTLLMMLAVCQVRATKVFVCGYLAFSSLRSLRLRSNVYFRQDYSRYRVRNLRFSSSTFISVSSISFLSGWATEKALKDLREVYINKIIKPIGEGIGMELQGYKNQSRTFYRSFQSYLQSN